MTTNLETNIKNILGSQDKSNSLKIIQKIKQKYSNNETLQKIIIQFQEKSVPAEQKNEENIQQEGNDELLHSLKENQERIKKAKNALEDKLSHFQDLTANKNKLIDEYTLGLSQTSSENIMEPLMKLKTFISNEEEQEENLNKRSQDANKFIQEKALEINAALPNLKSQARERVSFEEARSQQTSEKTDASFAEKLIEEFAQGQRRRVLGELENREDNKDSIDGKKRKYEQVFQEFSKTLETQEPYLKEKIEESVKKNLNLEQKKAAIKRLQETLKNLVESNQNQNKQQQQQPEPQIQETSETGEENLIKALNKNQAALKHVQASKIRINQFIADSFLSALEDTQKTSRSLEINLSTTFENWEKIYMLPPDIFYNNTADEHYSPILQDLADVLNQSNKSYFYLPSLIKELIRKINETSGSYSSSQNIEISQALNNSKRVYQQKKRRQIGDLSEVSSELDNEIVYKGHLQNLLQNVEHSPAISSADALKQYDGRTLSDYLTRWKKMFGPLNQKD